MNVDFPDAEALVGASDSTVEDLPEFAVTNRERDPEAVADVTEATRAAVDAIEGFDDLAAGASVAITAGSRGIHDMPAVLSVAVDRLAEREFEPFVIPAMGSHGGATAEGQRETLDALGITPESLGCEIRSSMAVEEVGEDALGRPVYAARDALEADAVLLANRVKPHTDFRGDVESGLAKMAVIGLGKHRGAESLHNAAIATDFADVIADRYEVLRAETPIVGGIALVENADHRAARIAGIDAAVVLDREPELLDTAREHMAELPVDDLDLLVVDETGKNHSGTGMDTNVIGRYAFHGEVEPDSLSITRVYARSLSAPSHGNAIGMGLADFVHRDLVADVDFTDTYVNVVTSGEPRRAKLPVVVPDDATALVLACSTTGVADPADLRVARIPSTMNPDSLVVSAPVAAELRERPDVTVGPLAPLEFDDGALEADPY
ncbi:nickel pincer cofactor-dependent isomerase, group 22 [Halosimplex sp. J119]